MQGYGACRGVCRVGDKGELPHLRYGSSSALAVVCEWRPTRALARRVWILGLAAE